MSRLTPSGEDNLNNGASGSVVDNDAPDVDRDGKPDRDDDDDNDDEEDEGEMAPAAAAINRSFTDEA